VGKIALTTTWQNSGWAVPPSHVLVPPAQYGYIAMTKVSNAGNLSIMRYVMENNLVTTSGRQLQVYPLKWSLGAGAGGTIGITGTVDRMIVYSKEKRYVRYPKTLLSRTPIQYDGIYHKCSYYARLGCLEVVYPETISYWDGL